MSTACALLAKQQTAVPQNVIDQDLVNNHIALPADDAARSQQPVSKRQISPLYHQVVVDCLTFGIFAPSCRAATPIGPWLCYRSLAPQLRGFQVCREGSALRLPSSEGRCRLINLW